MQMMGEVFLSVRPPKAQVAVVIKYLNGRWIERLQDLYQFGGKPPIWKAETSCVKLDNQLSRKNVEFVVQEVHFGLEPTSLRLDPWPEKRKVNYEARRHRIPLAGMGWS